MLSTKLKEAAGNSADATLYVDDVFSTYLYTGNGSTQTITNGIDLAAKGGMVWQKRRNSVGDHTLGDTARGVNKAILTDYDGAEFTGSQYVNAFNSNGFSFGNDQGINKLNDSYVSWTFRKAAKFFDTQTVTHTIGTANNIDLSVLGTVGMVIAKITTTTGAWTVWQRSLTASNNLKLNTTAAQSTTDAWLSVSGTTATLASTAPTGTYVIYAYAHDTSSTGIIQCGSYTGNGSATAPVVTLGWEPQYLMVKNASGTGNWQVIDSMRGMPVGSADATLQPNLANAESSVEYLSPTATGFQITSTSTEVNTNGSTYIYMAIRMPNKPPTTGTQVYNTDQADGTGAANPPQFVSGFVTDLAWYQNSLGSAARWTPRLTSGYLMESSSTAAELVSSATKFDYMNGWFNANLSSNYWSAMFKRAPRFFDVVCYTGTGSATTQAHNLTVVPELMIVKERSAANNWWVYDAIDGNTKYSVLNSTAIPVTSATAWNNTTPTASVFSIGTGANVNASTQTFVAYLFATLAGISKVGSYTGNGTGQAIACGFSAGARFVLIKRTDSTGDWYTFDSARGLTSGSSPYLLLNSTAAEVTGNNGVYASTGGFTLGSTASTTTNINAATYIFLAVA